MRMRKKKNSDKRLESLSALLFCTDKSFHEQFYKNYPVRIEIGCGKGDFINKISERDSDYNYIAVEKVKDVLVLAIEKYAFSRNLGKLSPHGLWERREGELYDGERIDFSLEEKSNVRFIVSDAADFLKEIPDSSVDTIYTNFSDPWPKKGYIHKRLSHSSFLKEYYRVLMPGGKLILKTDNDDYFDFSVEEVKNSDFTLFKYSYDIDEDSFFSDNIVTEYENNFREKGIKIKSLIAVAEKKVEK